MSGRSWAQRVARQVEVTIEYAFNGGPLKTIQSSYVECQFNMALFPLNFGLLEPHTLEDMAATALRSRTKFWGDEAFLASTLVWISLGKVVNN